MREFYELPMPRASRDDRQPVTNGAGRSLGRSMPYHEATDIAVGDLVTNSAEGRSQPVQGLFVANTATGRTGAALAVNSNDFYVLPMPTVKRGI